MTVKFDGGDDNFIAQSVILDFSEMSHANPHENSMANNFYKFDFCNIHDLFYRLNVLGLQLLISCYSICGFDFRGREFSFQRCEISLSLIETRALKNTRYINYFSHTYLIRLQVVSCSLPGFLRARTH